MSDPQDTDELAQACAWVDAGHGVALATVLKTWGSSPRRPGSHLAIRDDGLFVGSVSGGCVEGKVVEAALGVIGGADPTTLTFGVSDEEAWGVGLACGGTVVIRVDALNADVTRDVQRRRTAAQPVAWVQDLQAGTSATVTPQQDHPLADAVADALRSDRTSVVEHGGGDWMVRPYNPPLRLLVVGAVHIAQALATMAQVAGWHVVVVDPRTSFARPERFAGVELVTEWPDDGLQALGVDTRTAVVTLTHDPKLDDPALEVALPSEAFYVGALGSRKTQASRRERLLAAGVQPAALDRLHAPVGLPLGARSPAEIALSILAQITEVLRRPPEAS